MVPGTGGDLATWVGYNEAKRSSKNSELFGTGIPEGVVASEAANNAVTGGSLIPLMVLGIPGSSVTAVLLGGFLVHGLRPGPKFMTEYGDLSYTIILSLFIINLIMLGSGLFFGKMGVLITKIKDDYLAPVIITLSVIGSYAISNSMFDVGLMFVFGLLGYVMVKYNIPRAPMVLGLILGPLAETGLQQSLLISSGNWMIFLNKPLSLGLLVIAFISLTSAIYKDIKRIKKTNQLRRLEAEESNIIDSE
ncbi:MAG: tripartite tricarboxylate transporter permease, partial [Atribacterota bacterium]|nr:tripartite tricarboxylate transporter permease [Atribacterota bacterium]